MSESGDDSGSVGVEGGEDSDSSLNTGGPGADGNGSGTVDGQMNGGVTDGGDHGADGSGSDMMTEDDPMLSGNDPMDPGYPGMSAGGGVGGQNSPSQSRSPSRPSSFSDWTDDDFRNAVRERDELVVAAIKQKVKSAPGDAAVAKLLQSLLAAALEAPRETLNNGGYGGEEGYGDGFSEIPGPGGMPGAGGDSSSMIGNPGAGYPGMGPAPGASGSGAGNPGRPSFSAGPGGGSAPVGGAGGGSSAPPTSSIWRNPKSNPMLNLPRSIQIAASARIMLLESLTQVAARSSFGVIGYAQVAGAGQSGSSGPPPLSAAGGRSNGPPPLSAAGGRSNGPPPLSAAGGGSGTQGQGNSPPGSGDYGRQAPQVGKLTNRQLVEAVVEGLLDNDSADAWSTIHGLLTDQVKSPLNPEDNSQLIVERLFHRLNDSATSTKLTLTAIINGSAPLPAGSRSAALRTIASISAEVADTVLGVALPANQIADTAAGSSGLGYPGGLPGTGGMPGIGGAGGAPGAGMGIDGGADLPVGDFGSGNPGNAPGFGNPPPVVVSGPPLRRIALEGAVLQQAALFLWGPEMISVISDQLRSASDPNSAADMVTLAACIPNQTIRHALHEAFMRWHAAGANGLMATGLFDHNCHDPGVLLVLKGLPRPRPARNGAAPTPDSWAIASSQAVLNLRDRLRKAATSLPRFEGNSPLRLHRDAVAEVSVVMTMPGEFAAVLGAAAPAKTRVFYTKTTFIPSSLKEQAQVAEHYESRSSGIRRADPQRGLLWMDGVRTDASGVRRTMDVLIQQAGQGSGAPGDGFGGSLEAGGGSSFSIEVIVVEAADPKELAPAVSSTGGQ